MPPHIPGPGTATRDHLAAVETTNAAILDEVADLVHATVTGGGVVFSAGSGHSLGAVLETFYRAGGLACVHPVYHPGLLPLTGAAASTALERVEGLAAHLIAAVGPRAGDVAVVFSHSGVNALPVELARGFSAAGTPVVAVCSRPHMARAPARVGAKLGDVAHHVVDTAAPVGDAAYRSGAGATAAISTLVAVFCWNLILAKVADRAAADGTALPLWASANVEGGDERNAALARRYRDRIPML